MSDEHLAFSNALARCKLESLEMCTLENETGS